jgi:chemotaxis methyl-accepting protein methylase
LLGVKKNSFRIKIRATDIDPNIVRIAKCGIYEERHLRETPSEYVKK